MWLLDPDSSGKSSEDELDDFLVKNNFMIKFDSKEKENYAELCNITNLYFGAYTSTNYPHKNLSVEDSRLIQSIFSKNITDPLDLAKK